MSFVEVRTRGYFPICVYLRASVDQERSAGFIRRWTQIHADEVERRWMIIYRECLPCLFQHRLESRCHFVSPLVESDGAI